MEPACTRPPNAPASTASALALACVAALAAPATLAVAQDQTANGKPSQDPQPDAEHAVHQAEYPAGFDEEAAYYDEALGPLTRPVTTSVPRAQQFFDQGLQQMYAFTPLRAARSFRQAQREDPGCAMCFWGEAWAWGPYLNGPMGPDDAPRPTRTSGWRRSSPTRAGPATWRRP